jgi:hypothetical protein
MLSIRPLVIGRVPFVTAMTERDQENVTRWTSTNGWRNDSWATGSTCGRSLIRMIGSLSEADDAVQEAWLRLSRSDASGSSDS